MFEEEKDRIEREGDELNSGEVTIGKKFPQRRFQRVQVRLISSLS